MGAMARPGPRRAIRLVRPTVNKLSLLAALLIILALAMPSDAGYSFVFSAEPPPGPGGEYGSVYYEGPNYFYGGANAASDYGILGIDTPLNSGKLFNLSIVTFSVYGGSGGFSITNPDGFDGGISNVNVGSGGGSFVVYGFLSSAAAAFFGIPQASALSGVVTLQLTDPYLSGGNGNKVVHLQLVLTQAAPEPSSVAMTGIGLVAAFGVARGRRRRGVAGT
jgi:hypothetical protein